MGAGGWGGTGKPHLCAGGPWAEVSREPKRARSALLLLRCCPLFADHSFACRVSHVHMRRPSPPQSEAHCSHKR
eukprot:scaffold3340_cov114-Isochrysis_galbana.AAC.4